MRYLILAGILGLAACGAQQQPASAEPGPGEALMSEAMKPGLKRLFQVDSVAGMCANGTLVLQVGATANSGGWGEPSLRRLSLDGGTVTYEVIAEAPGGPAVTMVMQMFMLTHTDGNAAGIARVRVVAANNEMTVDVPGCPSAGGR